MVRTWIEWNYVLSLWLRMLSKQLNEIMCTTCIAYWNTTASYWLIEIQIFEK